MLVLVEVDDRVATVTLNRPEARNAISGELHALLDETITGLDARDDIGCIVLTGADPAFCAGMDLKSLATELREVQKERQRGPAQRSGMMPPHDTPVIGAINGATVTGGLELAMCCDFLIASERARFADTHARVGVMPGGGMTIRLPQLVGLDRARRMSLTGDYIDAETARDWGLVVEVVPHEALLARAREVAATIAGIPAEYLTELRRGYDEIGALSGRAGVRRRGQVVARLDGGALRPVAPDHRAREDRGPRPRPDRGTRRRRPGVKVYAGMDPRLSLHDAVAHAQRVERLGYDGLHVAETVHDSMAVALLAAEHTERITVRTSVTLAFARSPTLLAYAAWDIAKISGGRFELGLGTQVRQNIEDRYAVPFGQDPVGRLGDYVGAVRAAFASFASGAAPAYESPHYSVTRMQPYFNPGPDAVTQPPRIYLGGVQRKACALAGAVARRLRQPPDQFESALLGRDLPPRPGGGRPRRGAGPDLGRVRDRHRDVGDHRGEHRRGHRRTGAPAPAVGLLVLDARLRPDPRALRLDRNRSPPAGADPSRPLGRPGRGAVRRGARHPGPQRHLRRAPRRAARPLHRLGPGHRRLAASRPARRRCLPCRRGLVASRLSRRRLSAAWGR